SFTNMSNQLHYFRSSLTYRKIARLRARLASEPRPLGSDYAGITLLILLMAAPLARGQEYFPPPDSEGGWRILKDAAQLRKSAGMDLQKLDWAFDYASRSSQHGG